MAGPAGTRNLTPDSPVERIIGQIRAAGGRITGPRRAMVETLVGAGHRHLSADDIEAEVRRRHPDVAPSTIYRILGALEDLGVVTHVHLGHGPSTYHLAEETHWHLVCRVCDAVTEIPDEELAGFRSALVERYGFEVAEEHFALGGLCRRCRRASASSR